MKKIFETLLISFFILYAVGQFFPDVKMASRVFFSIFIVFAIGRIIIQKTRWLNASDFLFIMALLVSMLIGYNHSYSETVLSEAWAFFSLWLTCKIVQVSIKNTWVDMFKLQRGLYYTMIVWMGVYVVLCFGGLMGIIPYSAMIQMLSGWMANRSMDISQLGLHDGFMGLFPRLATGLNIVPLFIWFTYTLRKRAFSWPLWVMTLLFVLIDYGRLNMAFFGIATLYFLKKNIIVCFLQKRLERLAIAFFCIFFIGICFSGDLINIFSALSNGFGNERTFYSNIAREEQIEYLWQGVSDNPLLGAGMGAYCIDCIRNAEYWQYEMQTLAFCFQLGIFGIILIVINFIWKIYRDICESSVSEEKNIAFLMLVWFIGSSLQGGIFFDGKLIFPILLIMLSKPSPDFEEKEGMEEVVYR